ncbi:MAG: TetR/AcrR family transcriptional regulator [Actinomycetota bacterium]|nr:TetR/AcrR family transcriptional regulator [Actinomycetota bacterium]
MGTRRVRLSPATRREQLLDLGLQLLQNRPLEELSIDLLAEEAGISRGLLYHYFRGKQDFHRAVVRRAADELIAQTAPEESLPPIDRLTASLQAYVDYVLANYAAYVSLVKSAAGGDEVLRAIYEDTRTVLTARIFDSLDELGLDDTPAVRLLARGWSAMVEETVLSWAPEQQVPKERLVGLLAEALPAMLAGAEGRARSR